jgi:hypothetical protein
MVLLVTFPLCFTGLALCSVTLGHRALFGKWRPLTRKIARILFSGSFLNCILYLLIYAAIGGNALAGRAHFGQYYVARQGKETEVSEGLYGYSFAHGVIACATSPFLLLGFLLLAGAHKAEQDAAKPKKTDWRNELAEGFP